MLKFEVYGPYDSLRKSSGNNTARGIPVYMQVHGHWVWLVYVLKIFKVVKAFSLFKIYMYYVHSK